MATTVQFDGVSLQNVNRVVRSIQHDSAPARDIEILPLAREEGGILVSEHYQPKMIQVDGILKASSQSGLETIIDDFKELLSRKNKNLDITYASGTRRYVAYARNVFINRNFFHLNFAPYTIEFIVPAGVGKDIASTEALDDVSISSYPYSDSVTFSGSATPKPIIKLTFGTGWNNAYGIKFKNTDTDEECIITRSSGFSSGDFLEIDCENKEVKINDTEIEFYRVFPSFEIGSNNIEITAGDLIDQEFDSTGGSSGNVGTDGSGRAMSFTVPHTDDTYQGIEVRVKRDAGTSGDLTIEIQTDNNGLPSGTAVTNATFTIANADIPTDYAWVKVNSTNRFTLNANTRYWIVMWYTSGTGYWEKKTGSEATYGRGNAVRATGSAGGGTEEPTTDHGFRLLFGGKADSPGGNLTLDIDYYKRYL